MKNSHDEVRANFLAEVENTKFRSHKHAIWQAVADGLLIVFAYIAAHSWWARILVFIAVRFIFGFVIHFRMVRRERRGD
jgi:hypothetical protein